MCSNKVIEPHLKSGERLESVHLYGRIFFCINKNRTILLAEMGSFLLLNDHLFYQVKIGPFKLNNHMTKHPIFALIISTFLSITDLGCFCDRVAWIP